MMGVDIAVFMVDDMLVKTDRASMAHSLEARVPILDPVVAELALALPSRLKVRGLTKKRLLRRAWRRSFRARSWKVRSAASRPRSERGCATS